MTKITAGGRFYSSQVAFRSSQSLQSLPAADQHSLPAVHPAPAQFEKRPQGGREKKGSFLARLSSEDCQAPLPLGHNCQGLHLPAPLGRLLEVYFQDVI